jgi:cytochrome c
MKQITFSLFTILVLITGTLWGGDRGTADEAKAHLQKAVAHYKEVGRAKALEDFTGKKAPWVDRDLYVGCMDDVKHILVANGAFPNYVGQSLDGTKDLNGKPLGQSFAEAAAKGGIQQVAWHWFNPVTGKMEKKISLVQKVDDNTSCSVGYYVAE